MQDKAGRRTFLTLFKKDRILDLMIINFENTTVRSFAHMPLGISDGNTIKRSLRTGNQIDS